MFRLFAGIFGIFVGLRWGFAALAAYAGWCIRRRRNPVFDLYRCGIEPHVYPVRHFSWCDDLFDTGFSGGQTGVCGTRQLGPLSTY